MYHRIKEYKNIIIWICLSVIVNILMCINLLERKLVPFYSIASRKGLLLAQILADLAVNDAAAFTALAETAKKALNK